VNGDIDLNPFRRRLRKHGESADAVVLSIGTPKWQDASGTSLTHDYTIEVRPAGQAPFQAKVRDSFSVFAGPRVGHQLKVRFNPESHKVAFDLDGDPRYDLDAMTAGTPPAAPAAPVATVAKGPAERLEELGRLRDQGLITPEEFQSHRARLLELL
jgi:hypothetical protein